MIVPASRLLAWTAAAGLGLAGLAAARPALAPPAAAAAGLLVAVAALDAARGRRVLAGARVDLPPLVRLSRDQDGSFPVRVVPPAAAGRIVVVPADNGHVRPAPGQFHRRGGADSFCPAGDQGGSSSKLRETLPHAIRPSPENCHDASHAGLLY